MSPPLHHHKVPHAPPLVMLSSHPEHDVEGRNRSALSPRVLREHLKEFKFQRKDSASSLDYSSSSSKASSSSSLSSEYEDEHSQTTEDDSFLATPTTTTTTTPRGPATAAQVRSKFLNKLGIAQMPEGPPPPALTTPSKAILLRDEETYEIPLNDIQAYNKYNNNNNNIPLKSSPSFFQRLFSQNSSSSSSSSDTNDDTPSKDTHLPEHQKDEGSDAQQQKSLQEEEEVNDKIVAPPDDDDVPVNETTTTTPTDRKSLRFHDIVTVHPIPKYTVYSKRIRETVWTSAQEMEENVARNCLEFAAEDWNWESVLEDHELVYYHGELVHPVHFAA